MFSFFRFFKAAPSMMIRTRSKVRQEPNPDSVLIAEKRAAFAAKRLERQERPDPWAETRFIN